MGDERQELEQMFVSALMRLPNPVFSFDSARNLRPLNAAARDAAASDGLRPDLYLSCADHPLSQLLRDCVTGKQEGATTHRAIFPGGRNYEVEISARSPRGHERIVLVILRDVTQRDHALEQRLFDEWELTDKEREIVRLVASGRSTEEICEELGVSRNTIKSHITHIYGKTGTRSRADLLARLRSGGTGNDF